MTSGVKADPMVKEIFSDLKLGHKYKFIFFKLTENYTKIVLDEASVEEDYDKFLAKLPENDGRYAVYDFAYSTSDGERNKLVFVSWVPDTAKVKAKMLYASSKDAIKKELEGIQVEIQATEKSELEWDLVLEKAKRF